MPPELNAILRDFTPGAVGVWTGVVMFAGYLLREWRETRKMSLEDRLARRDGYAKQVEMLMGENRALRSDLTNSIREFRDYRALCHAETDQLRKHIISLESDVEGSKRQRAVDAIEMGRLKSEINHLKETTGSHAPFRIGKRS